MRRLLSICICTVLALSGVVADAQDTGYDVFNPIAKYISQGDAASLSQWFDKNLEVTVISSSRNCSKSQARQILRTFFDSYTPRSFQITHKASEGKKKYVLGNLNAGGEIFLVTIYTSLSGESYKIQQLVITRQTAVY